MNESTVQSICVLDSALHCCHLFIKINVTSEMNSIFVNYKNTQKDGKCNNKNSHLTFAVTVI